MKVWIDNQWIDTEPEQQTPDLCDGCLYKDGCIIWAMGDAGDGQPCGRYFPA